MRRPETKASCWPNQTGQYLQGTAAAPPANIPRIMPNPLDNTLLIQATPQDYAAILKLLA